MKKNPIKIINQHQRDLKKFGNPKFKDGDKVTTTMTGDQALTVKGNPDSNGFTWMYKFKEIEARMGQGYIRKHERIS